MGLLKWLKSSELRHLLELAQKANFQVFQKAPQRTLPSIYLLFLSFFKIFRFPYFSVFFVFTWKTNERKMFSVKSQSIINRFIPEISLLICWLLYFWAISCEMSAEPRNFETCQSKYKIIQNQNLINRLVKLIVTGFLFWREVFIFDFKLIKFRIY